MINAKEYGGVPNHFVLVRRENGVLKVVAEDPEENKQNIQGTSASTPPPAANPILYTVVTPLGRKVELNKDALEFLMNSADENGKACIVYDGENVDFDTNVITQDIKSGKKIMKIPPTSESVEDRLKKLMQKYNTDSSKM